MMMTESQFHPTGDGRFVWIDDEVARFVCGCGEELTINLDPTECECGAWIRLRQVTEAVLVEEVNTDANLDIG